ncbi:MAG TPA: aminotransferase class I/II-fold pyridoxal phosphate-dependent enzyme [Thermoplasmata archaeon]|nr:aminotransferase class I/II-fold pyridoxal phosphate-dependent enzyme [Thermoplasmata archaeon]
MVAHRTREVEISGIRKMFEAAPPNSINLGLGEPDFDPPKAVVEALCAAVRNGMNHYGPSAGLAPLREKIAERYRGLNPKTTRDNVIVTGSGSEGLMAAALALYDPGDEVLVPNPGFVLYGPHARLLGAVPVPYALPESRRFLPDLDELERLVTHRTKAIVVNSPSNPTGAVYPAALVDRIVSFADRHNLTIVSDEVYEEIIYDGPATSFWGRTDRVVIANSFSKTLAMTGWRLGFLVAPKPLAVELNKMHYHIMACPSTPAQAAALVGLGSDAPTRAMVKEFRARRALVVRLVKKIPGLSLVPPMGAFYAFPRFSWRRSATDVAHALLRRGLITTPGDAFGSLGASHLRLSFAASRENIRKGIGILADYAATDAVAGAG